MTIAERPFSLPAEASGILTPIGGPPAEDVTKVSDQPSDKFGIWNNSKVDTAKAYQLLPVDPTRKDALIIAFGNPIYVGDMGAVTNACNTPYTVGFLPPGVFALPASDLLAPSIFPLHYDSKASLWACCAVAGGVSQVELITSRFESGTPVT